MARLPRSDGPFISAQVATAPSALSRDDSPAAGSDPDRRSTSRLATGGAPGDLVAVGCVGIHWAGPAKPEVRHLAGESVELVHLHVERSVRHRGIGRALLAAAEHRCLLAGRTRVVVEISGAAGSREVRGVPAVSHRLRAAGYRRLDPCPDPTCPDANSSGPGPVPTEARTSVAATGIPAPGSRWAPGPPDADRRPTPCCSGALSTWWVRDLDGPEPRRVDRRGRRMG